MLVGWKLQRLALMHAYDLSIRLACYALSITEVRRNKRKAFRFRTVGMYIGLKFSSLGFCDN